MIRTVYIVVLIVAAALAAAWFADHPGALVIDWQGWRIEASVAVAAVALAAFVAVVALLYRFWLWLGRGPAALAESRARGRERRGYSALTKGLVAVAAGDAGEARRLARQAEALLESPPLTQLLSAQAAQLDGDDAAAARYFDEMLARPETEFLALRGLLSQAMRAGDTQAALGYATRAHKARPDAAWASDALFSLQAKTGQWKEAAATLADATKRKSIDREASRRRKAISLHAQALEAEGRGEQRRAIKLAEQAHDLDTAFVPAALLAGRLLGAAGKARRAADVIAACWRTTPHPQLAAAYAAIWPDAEAKILVEHFNRLVATNPGHVESRVALAGWLIGARQFDAARAQLEPLLADARSGPVERRLCRLMADLEEQESGQAANARDWLVRLADAAPDDVWVCTACGQPHDEWAAHCTACNEFDKLAWGRPGHDRAAGTATVTADGVAGGDAPARTSVDAASVEE